MWGEPLIIDFIHKNLRHAELQAREYVKKRFRVRTNSLE